MGSAAHRAFGGLSGGFGGLGGGFVQAQTAASGFHFSGGGLAETGESPTRPRLPLFVVLLVFGSSLGGVYLSIYHGAPRVSSIWHLQGLGKTRLVTLSDGRTSGKPQLALPSSLILAAVFVKFLARGAYTVTALLKFASLTSWVTQESMLSQTNFLS